MFFGVFSSLIRAAGAKLFFPPPYSADLNPIEQLFAKMKTLLRKTDARSLEDTWRIGVLLDRFSPSNAPTPSKADTLQPNIILV